MKRALLGLLVLALPVRADDWPQWLGPKRDGVWRETGIVTRFPQGGPKVLWRSPLGGGYAGPAVANGKVYVTDRPDHMSERILCLSAETGAHVWKHSYECRYQVGYPAGPRTTPVVQGGKVYTLGTMGDLYCLDADKGTVLWNKSFRKEYNAPVQNWGFSAHPLLDDNRLICISGGKNVAVAFDKDTGKELWRALDGGAGYAPPMIYETAGKRQLIIWSGAAVSSLDPITGKVYWTYPYRTNIDLSIATPRLENDRLFVSSFYNGPLMLKVEAKEPGASLVWRGNSNSEHPARTEGLHCLMSTPIVKDGYIYGVCSYGHLRCLKADTGERLWATLQATGGETARCGNAFLIAHEERTFICNEKGDLILARLSPKGYEEISRAHILEPTGKARRPVVWSHPAFAQRCMFARNDREIVCVSLKADGSD